LGPAARIRAGEGFKAAAAAAVIAAKQQQQRQPARLMLGPTARLRAGEGFKAAAAAAVIAAKQRRWQPAWILLGPAAAAAPAVTEAKSSGGNSGSQHGSCWSLLLEYVQVSA
jgi:hypothetical protein